MIMMEGSRGCWWGQKYPCTFCTLNGEKNEYRTKTPQRVFDEMTTLIKKYPGGYALEFTDNVLSGDLIEQLPILTQNITGVKAAAEVKPNLTEEQVFGIRAAGFWQVQAGIESLNGHLIRLLGKGNSPVGHIAFLKACRRCGLDLTSNILYRIPGEEAEDYEMLCSLLPLLYHLPPPTSYTTEDGSTALFQSEDAALMVEAIHAVNQGSVAYLSENPYGRAYCDRFSRANRYITEVFRSDSFHNSQIYSYLQRVRNRCRMESALIRVHRNIYYFPIAFELSHGCRVCCDFCGLMAERWTANAPYDRALWQDVIQASYDFTGPIVGESPLYFANEPLDNPDYERFLADVEEITGHIPQTTTAVAEREPERLRSLMEFLGQDRLRDQERLRFSIRSLSQFRRVTECFTPEELAFVELIPNNRESVFMSSDSGRNRQRDSRKKIRYSISCLAGVKVNLPDRTLSFVEPVLPDESYPCGIRVLETVNFANAQDYREKLESLFRAHAFADLPKNEIVRIHPNISVKKADNEIFRVGDGVAFRLSDNRWNEQMLNDFKSGSTFEQSFRKLGLPDAFETDVYDLLNKMFHSGYLL